jgi:4'-phosphopantetheinyl transferase
VLAEPLWGESPVHPVLAPTAVHVWRTSLRLSPQVLSRLEDTLSSDEMARAERFRFSEHRDAFTASRGILRDILSRYVSSSPAAIVFRYGRYGKPALAAPLDRSGIRFNMSNSGGLAIYAFTLESEVGIDVEELRPIPDRAAIAERFFSAKENETLRVLPLELADRAFFQCWTCKEAYIKGTGEGLTLPLDSFDVTFGPAEAPRLLRTRADAEEAKRWRLRGLEPARGYLAALAVHSSCGALQLYDWLPVVG